MSEHIAVREVLEELERVIKGEGLQLALSKWFLRYSYDESDDVKAVLRSLDEDDYRDPEDFRAKRKRGKRAR